MPKDTIYPFEGKMYGTTATCEAQAFLYLLGLFYVASANATLNVYYVCSIRYNMSEERIKKVVLPIMFAIATAISVSLVTTLFFGDYLNPQPHDFACSYSGYPKECTWHDDVECIRGDESSSTLQRTMRYMFAAFALLALIVIVSMCLVILTSYRTEMAAISSKQKNDALKTRGDNEEIKSSACDDFYIDDISISESAVARMQDAKSASPQGRPLLANTIIVSRQAGMYVGAFIITWVFTIMSFGMEDNWSVQILKCIFQPLQGFFNFLIFMYHKIHNVRRCNKDFGFGRALKFVFQSPSEVPEIRIVSQIKIVRRHQERRNRDKFKPGDRRFQANNRLNRSEPSLPSSNYNVSDLLSHETPPIDLADILSANGMSYASSEGSSVLVTSRNFYQLCKPGALKSTQSIDSLPEVCEDS